MRMTGGFTVVDILRSQGYEPEAPVSWQVGAAVRDAYIQRHGVAPEKALRRKTCGTGTHCFAVYPESFRAHAARIVADTLAGIEAASVAQPALQFSEEQA